MLLLVNFAINWVEQGVVDAFVLYYITKLGCTILPAYAFPIIKI